MAMYGAMRLIIALAILLAPPVAAGPSDHETQLTVLSGWTTASGSQMVGLQIDMADGWKTYWRAPGDAGIPPQVSWVGSQNIKGAAFHWPVPEVFYEGSARSIGYSGSVTIPIEIFPASDGAMRLSGTLDIGVCDEICVPVTLDFDQSLPASNTRDPAIVAALVDRPATASEAGISDVTCKVDPTPKGLRVTTQMVLPKSAAANAVIIETGDPAVWVSEPTTSRQGATLTASADLVHVNGSGFALDRSAVRITLLSERQAIDIIGCRAPS